MNNHKNNYYHDEIATRMKKIPHYPRIQILHITRQLLLTQTPKMLEETRNLQHYVTCRMYINTQ